MILGLYDKKTSNLFKYSTELLKKNDFKFPVLLKIIPFIGQTVSSPVEYLFILRHRAVRDA